MARRTAKSPATRSDRHDIGSDLKCPHTDETGDAYWSYGLINEVKPGDIVFHYSKNAQCVVGASVVGGPLDGMLLLWVRHDVLRAAAKTQERLAAVGLALPGRRQAEHTVG